MLQARQEDPIHEFYYVGRFGHVISFGTDGLSLTSGNGTLTGFADRLRKTHYRQFEADFNGEHYHISGAPIPTSGGVLLQMIGDRAFHSHRHRSEE